MMEKTLTGKNPSLGQFQVASLEESTNQESSDYKYKESCPN